MVKVTIYSTGSSLQVTVKTEMSIQCLAEQIETAIKKKKNLTVNIEGPKCVFIPKDVLKSMLFLFEELEE